MNTGSKKEIKTNGISVVPKTKYTRVVRPASKPVKSKFTPKAPNTRTISKPKPIPVITAQTKANRAAVKPKPNIVKPKIKPNPKLNQKAKAKSKPKPKSNFKIVKQRKKPTDMKYPIVELNSIFINKPKVLYVTSFTEAMYHTTGKSLYNSFINTKQDGQLLVCFENFDFNPTGTNLLSYPLHNDPFLKNWLEDNKENIPIYLGGKANPGVNPDAFKSNWNRLSSRWFRKVASINYALQAYGKYYDYLIWIDSDCEFTDTIPLTLYPAILTGRGMFYYFGPQRSDEDTGYETGFVGFNLKENTGQILLNQWIDTYKNKEYLNHSRWDDGYILRMVNEKNDEAVKTIDLAWVEKVHSPLEEMNIFYPYLFHKKGIHQRSHVMV